MGRPFSAKCGTPSGRNRHRNLGEEPCVACVEAVSAVVRDLRARDPEYVKRERAATAAAYAARVRLSERYPGVYRRLLAEERGARGLPS